MEQQAAARRLRFQPETGSPAAVLLCIWHRGDLLWVRHSVRGWELPGGKVEPDETAEAAAHRESREEVGAALANLQWIAAYDYPGSAGQWLRKWVYTAELVDISARERTQEISDVRVWRPTPSPRQVRDRSDFSYVVKDAVYETLWQRLVQPRGREDSPSLAD